MMNTRFPFGSLGFCYVPEDAWGFPGSSVVKNLPAKAGDLGSIPGSGRSPGGGNGNPLQYSCLRNPTDRGTTRATKESERLND